MNATTVLNKAVSNGAKWKLRVSYNKIPMYWKNGDFCKDTTIDLPYSAGYLSVKGLTCPQVQVRLFFDIVACWRSGYSGVSKICKKSS